MDIKTRIIHAGLTADQHGASSPPLYMASTFHQRDVTEQVEYYYGRSGNPTRNALESALAELEGGAGASAYSSGIAAIASTFMLFKPGDHLVVAEDIYGGTFNILTNLFARWGLLVSFVDTSRPEKVRAAVTSKTKGLFVETPSNPLLKITCLKEMAAIARECDLVSIIDNTFCTPCLQNPIAFGFDIVLHSATKFLNGHSDVTAGISVARTKEMAGKLHDIQTAYGSILGAPDSWLLMRGLRTLGVRLEAGQAGARFLCQAMEALPEVVRVYYPEHRDNPGREIHAAQARGGGAVFSFELQSADQTVKFLKELTLPLVAVSLGGIESIVSYPVRMSHFRVPPEERTRLGIKDTLLRFSVGLESPADLLKDVEQALFKAKKK